MCQHYAITHGCSQIMCKQSKNASLSNWVDPSVIIDEEKEEEEEIDGNRELRSLLDRVRSSSEELELLPLGSGSRPVEQHEGARLSIDRANSSWDEVIPLNPTPHPFKWSKWRSSPPLFLPSSNRWNNIWKRKKRKKENPYSSTSPSLLDTGPGPEATLP